MARPPNIVAIGCSWGGLGALSVILTALPPDLDAALVVVQHRPHVRSELANILAGHTSWPVCEADDKEPLSAGQVYLAPPGYHLLVEGDRFSLSTEAPVQNSRPSIDVLFESLASTVGRRAIGVVLTGANDDGAAGLAEIVRAGGGAVVQDPESAERRAMPDAALAAVPDAVVATLDGIGGAIARLVDELAREGSVTDR